MAYATLLKTKEDGSRVYQLRHSDGRSGARLTRRWTAPPGIGKRTLEKELRKQLIDFENACASGEIKTRAVKRSEAAERAAAISTFREYGERIFLPKKALEVAEGTRQYYEDALKRLNKYLGDMELSEITPDTILDVLNKEHAAGLSKSTLHSDFVTLSQLFKLARRNKAVQENPMDLVEFPRYNKAELLDVEPGPKIFALDDLRRILKYVDEKPVKWRAYFYLSADTGARKGELLALKWSDVDLKAGTVSFRRNLAYTSSAGVYLDTPKTEHSYRTIDISPQVVTLLSQLRREQLSSEVVTMTGILNEFVFCQETGAPMSPSAPNLFMNRMAKALDIHPCRPHMFRHTFASLAITGGADVASVSERLGHSSKSITLDMYTHADAEAMKRAADLVRAKVSGLSEETGKKEAKRTNKRTNRPKKRTNMTCG